VKQQATAESTVRAWAKRVRLPRARTDELSATLKQAFDATIDKVRQLRLDDGREFAEDTINDPLLRRLESILRHNVGLPLTDEDQAKAVAEARQRGKDRRPPGYMDAGPEGKGATGDYVLWEQILREAKRRQQDVLFVTADDKEDWWRKNKRKNSLGPRPELVDEMASRSGVKLFMFPPDRLLEHARDNLDLSVSDESVEDVKRISRELHITLPESSRPQDHLRQSAEQLTRAVAALYKWHPTSPLSHLAHSVSRLFRELDQLDLTPLLDATWIVLDAAAEFDELDDDNLEEASKWEQEVWASLDALLVNAAQAWLDDAADIYLMIYIITKETSRVPMPLPPSRIAGVSASPVIPNADGTGRGQIQFKARLMDGRQVSTTRTVPDTPEVIFGGE
jgi:hypothetical protein